MYLKELKKAVQKAPVTVQLISHEGDIYLCQINGSELLKLDHKTPKIFHSICEAKDFLGKDISAKMELITSAAYDEMIYPAS
ncbi:DUF6482 family protein [Endozoicomonas ascidiicola]|uniref:DUF6482 family protein n=1 Tax=Endozoicomonas ascidiicola TaxID=1698521 RepID=UPI00082B2590|nr:DUF6482 family protein [Endozoicomonas ascidiicola]